MPYGAKFRYKDEDGQVMNVDKNMVVFDEDAENWGGISTVENGSQRIWTLGSGAYQSSTAVTI